MKRYLFPAIFMGVFFLAGRYWSELSVHAGGGGAFGGNGDINGDGSINVTDVINLLNWMFLGGDAPVACADGGGLNSDQLEALSHISMVNLEDGQGGTARTIRISGVNVQIVNGMWYTGTANGLGNLIVGYNEKGRLIEVDRRGSHNIVAGKENNYTADAWGGLVVGDMNTIAGNFSSVSGGWGNTASGFGSSVSGGVRNHADGSSSSVSGGTGNHVDGECSSVSGGRSNKAIGNYSFVGGGGGATDAEGNQAWGNYSAILGGSTNVTGNWSSPQIGLQSTVSGGLGNAATGQYSSVSGGGGGQAIGERCSVSGGSNNQARGVATTVSGGGDNIADGSWSTVSGGCSVQTSAGTCQYKP